MNRLFEGYLRRWHVLIYGIDLDYGQLLITNGFFLVSLSFVGLSTAEISLLLKRIICMWSTE